MSARQCRWALSAFVVALLSVCGGGLAPGEAANTYIVGTSQNCPVCRAESLLILVNCVANNGDVIKVRKGIDSVDSTRTLYQFAPWKPQPQPGNCGQSAGCQQPSPSCTNPRNGKPLRIEKDITLIADIDRIILDGGAGSNLSAADTMCSALQCFKFPVGDSTKCRWTKITSADTVALIVVNRSRTSPHLQNASNLRIENFEIRNSFRQWQPNIHNHSFTNNISGGCGTNCSGLLPLIPGAGIEIWRAKISIENCKIRRNSTTAYAGRGGGIFASSSNLTVNNSTFEENYGGYYGGGLFASEGAFGSCSPCCDLGAPPSIPPSFPRDSVTVTVTNNKFRNNLAEFGAGLQPVPG